MTLFVDHIVRRRHQYSLLEAGCYRFVSKGYLSVRAAELKAAKKEIGLPGKKRGKETRYFFNNARILAKIARESEQETQDDVVAILFRDSDGTASAGRGLWEDKRKSMLDGFVQEDFHRGVPMIPKPKSEAWLLCALRLNPHENCKELEDRSGNDNSPNALKRELDELLGGSDSLIERLNRLIESGQIDADRIDMPSFLAFRERLTEVI